MPMLELTDADYDALYGVVKEVMPRVTRDMFPRMVAYLVKQGVVEVIATEDEIAMRMPTVPDSGIYQVKRPPDTARLESATDTHR